jgi:uncharacterized protein YndB with AHSA1/START domain
VIPAAVAQVHVELDPIAAFEVFTREIGLWWRRDTPQWNDRDRALSIRLEPGVGGRFVEVYDLETGAGFEVGRVLVWQPGERLAFTWTQVGWGDDVRTVVTVSFAAVDTGTLVTLTHDGFASAGEDGQRYRDGYAGGWRSVLGWYAGRAGHRSPGHHRTTSERGERHGDHHR